MEESYTSGYYPPETQDLKVKDYSFSIDVFSMCAIVLRAATLNSAISHEPLPDRFSNELRDLVCQGLLDNAVDRPVPAELVLHPLIRPYITLISRYDIRHKRFIEGITTLHTG